MGFDDGVVPVPSCLAVDRPRPEIVEPRGKVYRKAKSQVSVPAGSGGTIKAIVLKHLAEACEKASGGGQYRFSLRQLFYAIRPHVIDQTGQEPKYGTFGRIITQYESDRGVIPGLYRDNRGVLYHPHTGEEIPLGTLNIEQYRRPEWKFNKVLYCEKEGFFPILRAAKWPERHDCALMTPKGYATIAASDAIDLLGDTAEELSFYCIHDANAYGTTIYQALQGATLARPGRRVRIINLGLEPDEGLGMRLQVDKVLQEGKKKKPVGDYVDSKWCDWLQEHRIELNAMTTPQFLEWLDRKFADQAGKVVPPDDVLIDRLQQDTQAALERRITRKILRRANVPARVERAMEGRLSAIQALDGTIRQDIEQHLTASPAESWLEPIRLKAEKIAGPKVGSGGRLLEAQGGSVAS